MKRELVLIISFILILTMMFSVFSMSVTAKTLKDNPVPLAGGFDFGADDDAGGTENSAGVNPKTGDNAIVLVIFLAGLSLAAVTAGVIKKSRVS